MVNKDEHNNRILDLHLSCNMTTVITGPYLLAARGHGILGQLTTYRREMPAKADRSFLVVHLLHEPLFGGVCRVVTML